jgi:hypothetical protein
MFGWLIDIIMMVINFIMSFFSKKQVQFSDDTKKDSVTDEVTAGGAVGVGEAYANVTVTPNESSA